VGWISLRMTNLWSNNEAELPPRDTRTIGTV
jgi:hypothetical protein